MRTMEILEAEESGTSVHSNESKRCSRGRLVTRHSTAGPASASAVERLPRRVMLVSEESQRRCGGARVTLGSLGCWVAPAATWWLFRTSVFLSLSP